MILPSPTRYPLPVARYPNPLRPHLTSAEVREVTDMARRIAAIVLLEPSLDANYHQVKADTYPWPQ